MGYITSSNTLTLTAKLTPIGRQKLVSTNNSLISTFSLGDSDANYTTPNLLTSGKVPSISGDIGANNSLSNSTAQNYMFRSTLIVNTSGLLRKSVETQSINITTEAIPNGTETINNTNLVQTIVDRNNFNTDSLVNLFYSFGLPLNNVNDTQFTATTFANGGYSDTALSGLAQSKILVIAINNSEYGETLDGKVVKIELPTSAGTYNIYSTFQKKTISPVVEDGNLRDVSTVTETIGSNIAMLVSDEIMKPNGGVTTLSWATGFDTVKPFTVNGKQFYNLQTNTNLGLTADTVVGIAYLDKGFIVITNPTIVNNFSDAFATGTLVTFGSVSTAVYQNIVCIADRGEFGGSTNSTYTSNDIPRISELGLYDNVGNLIAVAKTDRHVNKNINEFKAFNVKISL